MANFFSFAIATLNPTLLSQYGMDGIQEPGQCPEDKVVRWMQLPTKALDDLIDACS